MPETDIAFEADRFIKTFARLMGGQLERKALTVSRGEFGVLMFLSTQDQGVTSGMIQDAMRIGAGGVANLLKSMDRKGFISKEQDHTDRRANCILMTEKGHRVFSERYEQIRRSALMYMEKIGAEESATFNDILEKILEISLSTELPE
ncbi:MAG: winged helix-turn-helix transcriptional regulator [Clostridiales bacterium]|nr:winged helix-turn-helix transcriptional regulator [Clostridiales bacterium]